jgi:hypothetical protein
MWKSSCDILLTKLFIAPQAPPNPSQPPHRRRGRRSMTRVGLTGAVGSFRTSPRSSRPLQTHRRMATSALHYLPQSPRLAWAGLLRVCRTGLRPGWSSLSPRGHPIPQHHYSKCIIGLQGDVYPGATAVRDGMVRCPTPFVHLCSFLPSSHFLSFSEIRLIEQSVVVACCYFRVAL